MLCWAVLAGGERATDGVGVLGCWCVGVGVNRGGVSFMRAGYHGEGVGIKLDCWCHFGHLVISNHDKLLSC